MVIQAAEEDVAHTLEVVVEVVVKDVVRATRKTKYRHFVLKCPERNQNHEVNLNETQEKGMYHEEGTFSMMNHIQETIFMNEEKYTLPKSESNTDDEDDVWYFDNGASNHMTVDANERYRTKISDESRIVNFRNEGEEGGVSSIRHIT
ncbi:hypothetical protein Tco_1329684 [Tanacetum coccineum]